MHLRLFSSMSKSKIKQCQCQSGVMGYFNKVKFSYIRHCSQLGRLILTLTEKVEGFETSKCTDLRTSKCTDLRSVHLLVSNLRPSFLESLLLELLLDNCIQLDRFITTTHEGCIVQLSNSLPGELADFCTGEGGKREIMGCVVEKGPLAKWNCVTSVQI